MTLHLRGLDTLSDLPVRSPLLLNPRPAGFYARYLKRPLDILLVLLSAPVTVPLVLLMMLVVALDGHAPVYRQARLGRYGRVYSILKIRTMVPDADALLERHLAADPAARAEWQQLQKLTRDPRVTLIGRFLRKSSLDELPQLWNVLTGDMSLVGPRPMMVAQKPLYPGQAYYHMRPGVTGPWQVSDRNRSGFADRAGFDEAYYRSMGLGADLRLIARTVSVVVRGTGC